ncbi:DMT family transporter [Halalkalibacterium ligniniphilum]|uniref:DMT family transporter n=1 Tax=Halalkalibacterium ligniniphilum TaxID=1134413 RepID=UPI000345913F|nr:multidrug efflux SMR transporter [Halalkalibacterium ligniniphilum]
MAWTLLIIAGLFEVLFVTFMKLSNGFKQKGFTLLCIVTGGLSFYLLSLSLLAIPIGTAYAIWAGIGAAGSVIVGMIFFKESKQVIRLLFLAFIVTGVVGLKVSSS